MNHEFWYLSRAAGFTAYLLLFVSVALGIAIGTRLAERFAKRNTIFDLHRFTTILALASACSTSTSCSATATSTSTSGNSRCRSSRRIGHGRRRWALLALYAWSLLIASFYVRQFIGYRAWRALHFLTFAMFAAVALHGITAGTDTTQPWAKLIYIATGAARWR